jgi:hypothetical protein
VENSLYGRAHSELAITRAERACLWCSTEPVEARNQLCGKPTIRPCKRVSFRIADHSPRTHRFFGSIPRVWIAAPINREWMPAGL